jgi:hypothetical protein
MLQVLASEGIVMPFVYFPAFYVFNTAIQVHLMSAGFHTDDADVGVDATVRAGVLNTAFSDWWTNLGPDMVACWQLWIPGTHTRFQFPQLLPCGTGC